MDLFSHRARKDRIGQPLAERMRPTTLGELVGQDHLVGPGKLLTRLFAAPELPSLLLWGPPGTGKTTLARLLADGRKARFVQLSAVSSGVKELRETIAEADSQLGMGARTILFLDEIHRYNKGQQDALLPHVEAGTITLVGATTENPSFELTSALLSRCTLVRLEALGEEALLVLVDRALGDGERGLGKEGFVASPAVRARIAREADGDARRTLGILEVAAQLAREAGAPPTITDPIVTEAVGHKAPHYDKGGDEHYAVTSAFIVSMRGSDPDAAVYWMARMLEGGEDPRFVLRRMVIFAAEDVGNADPRALTVATDAMQAFELVGMPEGVLPMTQACLYLATAPKSNSALTAYSAAREAIQRTGSLPVPAHLRKAPTALMKKLGWGKGYLYPHDFDGGFVDQEYLPPELAGAHFFKPAESGYEVKIAERLARWWGARTGRPPPGGGEGDGEGGAP